eukprot:386251_1
MSDKSGPDWTRLEGCKNQTFISNIVPLNETEFIICGDKKSYHKAYISKYNTKTNKWTHITINDTCKTGTTLGWHSISIDMKLTKLFSCGTSNMSIINIKDFKLTKKLSLHPTNGNGKYHNCSSLMINNKYHVIGGIKNKKHLIWNNEQNKFDEMYHFKHLKSGLQKAGFIYVKSKQICLLFGGNDCSFYPWERADHTSYDIWIFSMVSNQWEKSDIRLPIQCTDFGYCLTKNEKFIILFGGTYPLYKYNIDTIYIWQLDLMIFTKCKIKCPMKYEFRAVSMYDQSMKVVLIRMIRHNYCAVTSNTYPDDVIDLIECWIGVECVYLIDYLLGGTWKICLDDILFHID